MRHFCIRRSKKKRKYYVTRCHRSFNCGERLCKLGNGEGRFTRTFYRLHADAISAFPLKRKGIIVQGLLNTPRSVISLHQMIEIALHDETDV